jgi:hypothetical protein
MHTPRIVGHNETRHAASGNCRMERCSEVANMADSADYEMAQHRWAQLFLIRKDPNTASINRHRMLVFEDETLKRRLGSRSKGGQTAGRSRAFEGRAVLIHESRRHWHSCLCGFSIMFRLLYTASERVAKRAGFRVDCWLRSLSATPLRFEPCHDVFPS